MKKCRKVRYRDRIAAEFVLAKIRHSDSSIRAQQEKRAYRCSACGGWHLTHLESAPLSAPGSPSSPEHPENVPLQAPAGLRGF